MKTIIVLLILLLVMPGAVFAQTPTDTPAQPTQEPTDEPTQEATEAPAVVVEAETGSDVTVNVPPAESPRFDWNGLLTVIVGFVSAIIAGGGVFVIMSRAAADKPLTDNMATFLYNSISQENMDRVYSFLRGAALPAVQFGLNVTDGVPGSTRTMVFDLPAGVDHAAAHAAIEKALADLQPAATRAEPFIR